MKNNKKLWLLQNKYGEGTAYLLNYFMDGYPEEKLTHNNEASLTNIRSIFDRENLKTESAGAIPDFTISTIIIDSFSFRINHIYYSNRIKSRDFISG